MRELNMADNFYLKAIITAVDKISRPLKAIAEQAKNTRDTLGKIRSPEFVQSMDNIGKQIRLTRGHMGKLGRSVGEVAKSVALFTAGMAAVGYGMASIVTQTADAGGALDDLSLRTGMSAEDLQKWSYAAMQTGISGEDFNRALEIMNKNMGALKAGTGPLAASIAKISPALSRQLKGVKDNNEALDIMLKAIRQVPDANKRAYLATQFFGKSGMGLINLAAESEESLAALKQRAVELGILSNEDVAAAAVFGDRLDDLKKKWGDIKDTFATRMIPYLTPLLARLTDFLVANKGQINKLIDSVVVPLGEWLQDLDFEKITDDIIGFIDNVKTVISLFGGLKNVVIAYLVVSNIGLIKSILGAAMAFKGLAAAMGPVGLGLAALGVAAYLLYTHWDEVSTWLKDTWNGIVDAFYETAAALGDAVYPETVVKAWNGLIDFFGGLWDTIKGIFNDAIDWIGNLIRQFDPVRMIGDKLSGLFSQGFSGGDVSPYQAPAGVDVEGGLSSPSLVQRQSQVTATQQTQAVNGKIQVSFDNAPPGMRVSEVKSNHGGIGLDANVGYRAEGSLA